MKPEAVVYDGFGKIDHAPSVTFTEIADKLRALGNSAFIKPAQLDDVLVLIDHLAKYNVKRFDEINERSQALVAKEADLAQRERDLAVRMKAVQMALALTPAPKRRWYNLRG